MVQVNLEYTWIKKGDLVISRDNIIGYFDSWKEVGELYWYSECANNIDDNITSGTFRAKGLRAANDSERIRFENLIRRKQMFDVNKDKKHI